jgi:site-specific DNA-methyltransferase (adenine-specific)
MNPYYQDDMVTLYHGDNRAVLANMDSDSIDSCVTDPPYELGFMGKGWDGSGIAYDTDLWSEVWRVLKPGGHLLAFGGTRTWHRLAVAIEDAGFDVRDSMAWMYGSGFPKSLDVSKAIDKAAGAEGGRGEIKRGGERLLNQTSDGARDGGGTWGDEVGRSAYTYAPATDAAKQWQGWGTALKPAFEPVVVARKPLIGTVAENVQQYGTGALNIDGCRIGYASEADKDSAQALADLRAKGRRLGVLGEPGQGQSLAAAKSGDTRDGTEQVKQNTAGRWPANVILDESQAAELDKQSGVQKDGTAMGRPNASSGYNGGWGAMPDVVHGFGGQGGASRFFYTAKASKRERPNVDGVAHPTVKPIKLMQYLVRLVTPPGGTILEPFAGSGTTLEAATIEGFNSIGIELTDEYLPLIVQRLNRHTNQTLL